MDQKYLLNISDIKQLQYAPLVHLLDHHGIRFEQVQTDFGLQTYLSVDAAKLDHMTRRNAGPKEKGLFLTGSPSDPVYLSEIKELQKTMSMKEIANMYNVSRATLYRRIAEAKKNGTDQLY